VRWALFHGFLGSPAAWEPVLAHARLDSPPIAALLPGHGANPWTPAGDFVTVIDAIAARVFDAAGGAPLALCGYSMGARVALSLALRHPSRVARLVLVGVTAGLRTEDERRARIDADELLARRVERDGLAAFVAHWETLPMFETQRGLGDDVRAQRRAERSSHTAEGVAWTLRALGTGQQPDWREAFARSEIPTVLIAGERDAKFTNEARELAALRGGVRHVIARGAGHDVTLEAPAVVARCISQTPPSSE
jgi:2-succinyl-6-hydroxy-2,4-cyclohexadiene-1-carboxylate synthase